MPNVTVGDQVIHYIDEGTGDTVIFIHGVGMAYTMWQEQVEFFSTDYRVIAYDMIGHGESAKPEVAYQLDDFVEQLYTLMERVEIDKAHIVGFSMGGMVAQAFGIKYPDKCQSLCFMSAVANRTEEQQQGVLERVEQVKHDGHLSTIEPAISRWFNESFQQVHPEVIESVKARLKANDPISYLKAYTVFATADQEIGHKLNQIKSPTLIVTGESDIGSNPEMAKFMHDKINGSEMVIVPAMKHMLPMEGKDIVNNILSSFIKKHSN